MARSALFRTVRKALGGPMGAKALTRRALLVTGAALAACTPATGPSPESPGPGAPGQGGIAIVGGGVAGLTIAYRLARAGRNAVLYDASTRLGGRMFTRRNFNQDGQFCELGGELVDSNHVQLRALASELGIPIERLSEDRDAEDIYHHEGRLYAQHDMLDRNGRGAFREAATRIAADNAQLLDGEENWTERARTLDQMSLKAYLDTLREDAPDWAIDMIELAYLGEYGIPTDQQSALNLIDMIGTTANAGFQMFGDSDEAFRIHNGSSSLPEALEQRMGSTITQALRHELAAIARHEGGVTLTFNAPEGRIERRHERVVLALPFTTLRNVSGLGDLGLSEGKLRAIRELGYGDNAKVMISTRSRPWTDPERRFPARSNGTFYSDRGFQVVWETSRGQRGERGILTNFLSGVQDESAFARLASGLQLISPAIADSLDIDRRISMFWRRQPFALGSYAGARVGQYTTLLEHTALPELDGRLLFAGEHTSSEFLGYMNGAVESGERAAHALLGRG